MSASPSVVNDSRIAWLWPRTVILVPGGSVAEVGDRALDVGGGAAEVAAAHAGVDVDHALHRVVVDHRRRRRRALIARHVAEQLRLPPPGEPHGAERRRAERRHRVDHVLRRLEEHAVVDAVRRIEPVVRLQEEARAERGEQARRDVGLGDAELERLGAVDVDLDRRDSRAARRCADRSSPGMRAIASFSRVAMLVRCVAGRSPRSARRSPPGRPKFSTWLTMSAAWK